MDGDLVRHEPAFGAVCVQVNYVPRERECKVMGFWNYNNISKKNNVQFLKILNEMKTFQEYLRKIH